MGLVIDEDSDLSDEGESARTMGRSQFDAKSKLGFWGGSELGLGETKLKVVCRFKHWATRRRVCMVIGYDMLYLISYVSTYGGT